MAKTLAAMTQDNWAYGGTAGYARYEFSDDFVDEDGRQFEGGSKSYLEVATTISGGVVTVPAYPNFPTTESAIHNNGVTVTCYLLDSNRVKRTTLFEDVRIYTSLPSTITLSQLVLANGASRIQRDTDVWTKEQVIDYINTLPPAVKMTNLIHGIARLSIPAASATDPIAVGDNDPRILKGSFAFASLPTAGVQAGSLAYVTDRLRGLYQYGTAASGWASVTGRANVKDFGAVGDGTTNDRTAIQSAIQAVFDIGGGVVWFPNGRYNLGSTFNAPTNSLLYAPTRSNTLSPITIRLEGEFIGRGSENPPNENGVVLLGSNATGSGTYPSIFAAAAYADTSGGGNFNFVSIEVKNITFRTQNNPTLGGLNLHNGITGLVDDCVFDTGTLYGSISQPTNVVAALIMPGTNNRSKVIVRNTSVLGYHEGYRVAEHTTFEGNCAADHCNIGLLIEAGQHPVYGNFDVANCRKAIETEGSGIFVNLNLSMERYDTGVSGGAVWYASSAGNDIVGLGDFRGWIRYKLSIIGVGQTNAPLSVTLDRSKLHLQSLTLPAYSVSAIRPANQTLTTATRGAIGFYQESLNTVGTAFHNAAGASEQFIFDRIGWAEISVDVQFAANATGIRSILANLNNTTDVAVVQLPAASGSAVMLSLHAKFPVAVGDVLRIQGYQNSGGDLDVVYSANFSPRIHIDVKEHP